MDPYVGEIRLFAGDYAPVGWALCDGSTLSINDYQALYSLLGNSYGGNSTIGTFGLPDLRGRAVVGQGTGAGLTPRTITQAFGTETTTLTAQNTPAHSHSFSVSSDVATDTEPSDGSNKRTFGVYTGAAPAVGLYSTSTETTAPMTLSTAAVSSAGFDGPQPHANMMASVAINYIISLNGNYPSQP